MMDKIRTILESTLDSKLVSQLLEAYEETKQNIYLSKLRLNEVEGGRFCEAVFRILEQTTTGTFTPLGRSLGNTDHLIDKLEKLPFVSHSESVRVHIPRALRVVYDIRNKRDAAHLNDGIDPNLQDASLVCSVLDWVLAELIRLNHEGTSPGEAQRIVEDLVTRRAPVIQDFSGFLKVLNPRLSAGDCCLVLLYQRGKQGARLADLDTWVRPGMRANLKRTLRTLTNVKAFVHDDKATYRITGTGQQYIENRGLLRPQQSTTGR